MIKYISQLLICSSLVFSQQAEKVDFLELNAEVEIDTINFKANGDLKVKFKALQNIDSVYLDAVNMNVTPAENSPYKIVSKDNKICKSSNF